MGMKRRLLTLCSSELEGGKGNRSVEGLTLRYWTCGIIFSVFFAMRYCCCIYTLITQLPI